MWAVRVVLCCVLWFVLCIVLYIMLCCLLYCVVYCVLCCVVLCIVICVVCCVLCCVVLCCVKCFVLCFMLCVVFKNICTSGDCCRIQQPLSPLLGGRDAAVLQCCSGRGRDNCWKQTCIDCCLIGYCMDNVTVSQQHIQHKMLADNTWSIYNRGCCAAGWIQNT